jgi:hypothetical protein
MARRNLPSRRQIDPAGAAPLGRPWADLRRQAELVYGLLRTGWDALSQEEREQARKLLVKSKGRPNRLSREEARTLGKIAGRAAGAVAASNRKR